MNPKDEGAGDRLAWLGAAMTQTHKATMAGTAGLFAAFYLQLVAEGVPDDHAVLLTETYMTWMLERAAEAGQS